MDTATRKADKPPTRATPGAQEQALAERALDTLRTLGIGAHIHDKQRKAIVDYAVALRRGAKRATYLVEIKRTLRPATFGPVLLRLQQLKRPALLLTDYVTPQMAKLMRDAGVAFADTAGNAYLEFAGNIFYVVGNVPKQQPRTEKLVRAFQPTGLRVVFALICVPELVLDAFWPAEFPTEKPGLVPTPLIYADLLATGDARCIETAKLVYDEYLVGRLTQA